MARFLTLVLCLIAGCTAGAADIATAPADQLVRIGVLAHRGKDEAVKSWTATARYLSKHLPGYNFVVVPLNNDDIGPAVEYHEVEFVLTNPGSYAELEAKYGVTRIATLKSKTPRGGSSVIGAVIFTRADRNDIRTLADLKGKHFMAVHESAFGGWWLAWREFRRQRIDPYQDFAKLSFSGFPQDNVVYAVRDGRADAGTVRTDLLETLAMAGAINLRDFRILNPQHVEGFPYALSTRLYPDWAFAVVRHTPEALARQVTVALLMMQPGDAAAQAGGYEAWTVPLDYHSVTQLMQELRVGPFRDFGKVTYRELLRQYWPVVAAMLIALLVLAAAYYYTARVNRKLSATMLHLQNEIKERERIEEDLRRARDTLEARVAERTAELERMNEELESRVAHRTAQLISAMQRLESELSEKRLRGHDQ